MIKSTYFAAFRQQHKDEYLKDEQNQLDYSLNLNYDVSNIIGDNPNDDNERFLR